MDTALHTDLGRTSLPSLCAAPRYFFGANIIRLAAKILARGAFGESAELTFEIADVCVVDVAIDYVAYGVSAPLPAYCIRSVHYRGKVSAATFEQARYIGLF
jgi:hypothetical protein